MTVTKQNIRRRPRNWPSIRGDATKRASYALTRLEDITRLVAEWTWEVDADGAITYVSERVTEDLGLVPGALVGRRFADIGKFVQDAPCRGERAAKPAGGPPDWRTPFRDLPFETANADGKTHRLLVSGVPIFEPETWAFEGACGTARDTTELRASHEIKAYLEEANRLLREASDAKSAFLANMSHELRTPLNAILGFSHILGAETFGPLGDPRYLEYARDIQIPSEHLVGLVNDVLDLSAIEAGQLDLFETEVDLATAIDTAIDMVRQAAAEKSLNVKTEVAPDLSPVTADERSMRQVLLNLVWNAIKFTPAGGRVTVAAKIGTDGDLVLRVADTGIGIPARDLDLVLKPFGRRAPTMTSGGDHGIGLGLAITKSLVEKHGGTIRIDSVEGQGTDVEVSLPKDRVCRTRA